MPQSASACCLRDVADAHHDAFAATGGEDPTAPHVRFGARTGWLGTIIARMTCRDRKKPATTQEESRETDEHRVEARL